MQFFFQAADIVDQVLNFGQPAPIDIRISGPDGDYSFGLASKIAADLKQVPGIVDSHVFQVPKESELFWKAVREIEPFDPQRSLFVDDSPPVLRAARAAGIRWIRGVRRISAARGGQARPARDYGDIPAVESVSDLDPGLPWMDGRHGDLEGAGHQGPVPNVLPGASDVDDIRVRPGVPR